jgi:hypothetical protein
MAPFHLFAISQVEDIGRFAEDLLRSHGPYMNLSLHGLTFLVLLTHLLH